MANQNKTGKSGTNENKIDRESDLLKGCIVRDHQPHRRRKQAREISPNRFALRMRPTLLKRWQRCRAVTQDCKHDGDIGVLRYAPQNKRGHGQRAANPVKLPQFPLSVTIVQRSQKNQKGTNAG